MNIKMLKMAFVGLVLSGSGFANAGLITISEIDLLSDKSLLDFTSGPAGTVAGNETYFQEFGLSNVGLIGSSSVSGDTLNSGADGKALAIVNGLLSIVNVNDNIDDFNSGGGYTFSFSRSFSQFGFQIIDQINFDTTVQTFSNGVLVDSVTYMPAGSFPNTSIYYQSDAFIDEFRVISVNGSGGWALDNISIASKSEVSEVPEPSTIALLALGLMGLASRRFKK
jgi:hypothetical protein